MLYTNNSYAAFTPRHLLWFTLGMFFTSCKFSTWDESFELAQKMRLRRISHILNKQIGVICTAWQKFTSICTFALTLPVNYLCEYLILCLMAPTLEYCYLWYIFMNNTLHNEPYIQRTQVCTENIDSDSIGVFRPVIEFPPQCVLIPKTSHFIIQQF